MQLELANLYLSQNKPRRALLELDKLSEPDNIRALYLRAEAFFALDQPADAEHAIKAALALNPPDEQRAILLGSLSRIYTRLELYKEAENAISHALKLEPKVPFYSLLEADCFLSQEALSKAEKSLKRVEQLSYGGAEYAYYLRLRTAKALRENKLRDASRYAQTLAQLEPESAKTLFFQGVIKARNHRLDAALENFESAARLEPTTPLYSSSLRQAQRSQKGARHKTKRWEKLAAYLWVAAFFYGMFIDGPYRNAIGFAALATLGLVVFYLGQSFFLPAVLGTLQSGRLKAPQTLNMKEALLLDDFMLSERARIKGKDMRRWWRRRNLLKGVLLATPLVSSLVWLGGLLILINLGSPLFFYWILLILLPPVLSTLLIGLEALLTRFRAMR